jgi:hypothetical protein
MSGNIFLNGMAVASAPRHSAVAPGRTPAPTPAIGDEFGVGGKRQHAPESPLQRKRRIIQTGSREMLQREREMKRMLAPVPEEIDNDYNDFGSPEQEGHGHRRDREEECFEKTVWDRTFKEILRSEYYIGRFRVRVAAIIARSEWADRFAQTFMHFAEAGKKHIAFTQLTLTRAPVSDCACSACGNSDMEIVSTAVAEMGFKRYRWTLCDTCDATLVWVANCYSTLWAISLPTNGYPKQGYAAFMTPAFVNDTERGGKTAYRELEALLEEGVESGLYSPVYSARK